MIVYDFDKIFLGKDLHKRLVYGILLRDSVNNQGKGRNDMKSKIIYWLALLAVLIGMVWLHQTGMLGESFWGIYGIVIAIIFVSSIFFNRRWMEQMAKQTEEMKPLLQSNPKEYTAYMERCLRERGRKNRVVMAMLLNNIGAGYMAQGEYKTALEKLLTVPEKGLNEDTAQQYYINLCLTLFHLEENDAACKLLRLKAMHFQNAKNNPRLCAYYDILQILQMIADVKRKEAKAYLMKHPELEQREDCKTEIQFIHKKL